MYDQTHIVSVFKEILRYETHTFKRKTYDHAIRIIKNFVGVIPETDFTTYDGIGDKINLKIHEIYHTGTCDTLEDYKKTGKKLVCDEEHFALEELMQLPTIGIVKAKALYTDGYRTLKDIETAIENGKLPSAEWLPKLQAIHKRVPYETGITIADKIITEILKSGFKNRYIVCGSLRRKKETIKDIDIVLECNTADEILGIQKLAQKMGVIIQAGNQSVRFIMNDINIDLRLTSQLFFGSMVNYYTGSAEFNIRLRADAKRRGWLINERGVWLADNKSVRIAKLDGLIIYIDDYLWSSDMKTWYPINDEKFVDGSDEKDLFEIMDVAWVEPENRI